MTLTSSPELNEALGKTENWLAVAHAIDYDGIIEHLMGGNAVRPVNFLPIGVGGSTEEPLSDRLPGGSRQVPRALGCVAGNPDGFSFQLSYANAAIVGTSYQLLAQKIQSDLPASGSRSSSTPDQSS
ncbi:MAG: hypothetical protein R3D25_13440 [Geminicoccaceae bacterium]